MLGTSYEDWRQYGNEEGNLGSAIKSGLMAYGMNKSGLQGWLDDLGKKGVAPPSAQINPIAPQSVTPGGIPPSSGIPIPEQNVTPTESTYHPQTLEAWGKTSYVNPQASRDIPISGSTDYSHPATKNWDQYPGDGKLAQLAAMYMMA